MTTWSHAFSLHDTYADVGLLCFKIRFRLTPCRRLCSTRCVARRMSVAEKLKVDAERGRRRQDPSEAAQQAAQVTQAPQSLLLAPSTLTFPAATYVCYEFRNSKAMQSRGASLKTPACTSRSAIVNLLCSTVVAICKHDDALTTRRLIFRGGLAKRS